MKVYRGTDGDQSPVEMECEKFGYPHETICGEIMYDNTHFKTEAEAWQSILASVHAIIFLSGSAVKQAEFTLQRTQKDAGNAAKRYVEIHNKYKTWKNAKRQNHIS